MLMAKTRTNPVKYGRKAKHKAIVAGSQQSDRPNQKTTQEMWITVSDNFKTLSMVSLPILRKIKMEAAPTIMS